MCEVLRWKREAFMGYPDLVHTSLDQAYCEVIQHSTDDG